MRDVARRDRGKDGVTVERNAAKCDLDPILFDVDARVGRERVDMEVVLRLHVVVRKTDAAGIHEQRRRVATQPLKVYVTTREHVGARRAEQAAELVLVEVRQDHVVERARGSVEGEELALVAEGHRERWLKRLQVRESAPAELCACPFAHVELLLVRRFRARVGVEDERVGVAEDRRALELLHELHDLPRLAAALHRVAEADELIDRIALEVGQHRLERDRVAVDVRNQRGADAARLRGDRLRIDAEGGLMCRWLTFL